MRNSPMFSLLNCKKYNIIIIVESGQTVSQAPYRVSEFQTFWTKKENNMQNGWRAVEARFRYYNLIRVCQPSGIHQEPNCSDRICVDYRRLNMLIKMKNFPVSNIDEFLQEAKRFNFFFSLDLNSEYFHLIAESYSIYHQRWIVWV